VDLVPNFEKVWKRRVAPNDGAHVLETLVQPLKNVEDEDSVFDGWAEVARTVGHGLELAAVLRHREVTLNKVAKGNIKMKSMLLTVAEKLVLDGEPQVARRAAAFPDHLVKLRRDGIADPVEDDAVHSYPPRIIRRSILLDVLDEDVAFKSLPHEVTPAGVVGGGVEDDVHQLTDIEDRSRLKGEGRWRLCLRRTKRRQGLRPKKKTAGAIGR
jgi:hypothetical protein